MRVAFRTGTKLATATTHTSTARIPMNVAGSKAPAP